MEYRVKRIDNGDELIHKKQHKYIDKIRMKNGKYRYIYDKLGFDERDAYRKAKKELDAANKEWEDANNDYFNVHNDAVRTMNENQYRNGKIKPNGYHPLSSQHKHLLQQRDRAYDRHARAGENRFSAKNLHDWAKWDYEETPLYKLEKAANKGENFLKKLFKIH